MDDAYSKFKYADPVKFRELVANLGLDLTMKKGVDLLTHPRPLLATGVSATPQKSPTITSND